MMSLILITYYNFLFYPTFFRLLITAKGVLMSNILIKYQFYNMKSFQEVQELHLVLLMTFHQKETVIEKETVWVLLHLVTIRLQNLLCDLNHQGLVAQKKLVK